ncbi:flagellin [Limimaricola hongkongensis]|uniref:Flagellin n=1 Tax=Limimaricola hongkongensis DSM 17492 TaxID=1122180 RepID=A0A017HHP1_9RHOB|nr:flagellin [Limimaricola hongkongensis]EYD73658.1 Flagellin protein FlaA [Limimaricola hongkongensis DSM 17492]
MSSILTNNSAMSALSTLRNINSSLSNTQDRISSGLKVSSGKDNAAYFSISETMKGDSGMTKSVNEGLTLTKNVVSTGRLGAETVKTLAKEFSERVAFAQAEGVDRKEVQKELDELVKRIGSAIDQSSFNGNSVTDGTVGLENAVKTADELDVVTGLKRDAAGAFSTTSIKVSQVNLSAIKDALATIDINDQADETTPVAADAGTIGGKAAYAGTTAEARMKYSLEVAELALGYAVEAATTLGVAEKTLETQQEFLTSLSDRLDSGVGSMVDANMEEEAARLQALQVQQQLSSQALSIANQAPQNILSLFR